MLQDFLSRCGEWEQHFKNTDWKIKEIPKLNLTTNVTSAALLQCPVGYPGYPLALFNHNQVVSWVNNAVFILKHHSWPGMNTVLTIQMFCYLVNTRLYNGDTRTLAIQEKKE